jgi:hypothetical protein
MDGSTAGVSVLTPVLVADYYRRHRGAPKGEKGAP